VPLTSGVRSFRFTRSRSADGAHGVEHDHAAQLHVGDEDLLVGRASHLEPLRLVPDRGGGDEVVAVAAGEGDGEPAVPIGARAAFTPPPTDVAVTLAFSIGSSSSPVT
jgi:hypothetical protein